MMVWVSIFCRGGGGSLPPYSLIIHPYLSAVNPSQPSSGQWLCGESTRGGQLTAQTAPYRQNTSHIAGQAPHPPCGSLGAESRNRVHTRVLPRMVALRRRKTTPGQSLPRSLSDRTGKGLRTLYPFSNCCRSRLTSPFDSFPGAVAAPCPLT